MERDRKTFRMDEESKFLLEKLKRIHPRFRELDFSKMMNILIQDSVPLLLDESPDTLTVLEMRREVSVLAAMLASFLSKDLSLTQELDHIADYKTMPAYETAKDHLEQLLISNTIDNLRNESEFL